jgi:predicted amidohydrolase YtcJ
VPPPGLAIAALLVAASPSGGSPGPSMKDVLVVGRIHTLDPARPLAEAVLVREGRIACAGAERECAPKAAAGAVRIEAGSAVPGLTDAHGHVQGLGTSRRELSCVAAASEDACAALAGERARSAPAGSWIHGRGWDQNRWPVARFPSQASLTRAAPDHPVVLVRVDGHASWVNARALAAAGIGPATPDPPGGKILRGADGAPTGVLVDRAQELVLRKIPPPTAAEIEDELLAGLRELAALGLTEVHDAGVGPAALDAYARLAAADRLPLRVYAMIDGQVPLPALEAELSRWKGRREVGLLTVRAVKLYADGALGSRGAALHEDYADDPGNRGLLVTEPDVLRAKIRAIAAAGFQPAVHAIGDRAVSIVLDAFEAAGDLHALRPRIEHLQIVLPRDVPRLAALGAVASMQPVHATSDGPWVAARLGAGTERYRGAYAWRTVVRAGVPLAFGSDFPVEDADPRAGIAAAEERIARDGKPFTPEQRLSREEALRAFTAGAAWAAFAERRRGMLREGFDADLTIFADDLLAGPPDRVRRMRVTHTIAGGRVEGGGRVRSP